MRTMVSTSITAFLFLTLAGCARDEPAPPAPTPPPYRIVATPKQVMHAITIPAADVVWGVPSEPPKEDAEWLAVENAALALIESGNLLMMEGRAPDQNQWMKETVALMDAAMLAVEAARAKNVEKMAEAGDVLYTSCESCHKLYMPQVAAEEVNSD